jgi:adenylyltransferase/sulfurtransferase
MKYSRQIQLAGIGEEGQSRLLRSRVLLVGAGGLGSPIALYLAAGGVGALGIVDLDTVALSNIHRQILYGVDDVGRQKTDAALEKLRAINPDVAVTVYQERFQAGNALDLAQAYDVIVDGSDNLKTKFLLNDAAHLAGKPYIFGAVSGFEGQAGVFFPKEGGPCLRCMFPDLSPAGLSSASSEAGVLGMVPGLIGLIQAGEVIKLILDIGKPLTGRFLVYDYLEAEFRNIAVSANPACPLCGENPSITDLSAEYR